MRALVIGCGIALVIATYISVLRRLVVPRNASLLVPRTVSRTLVIIFRLVARGRPYPVQDRVLASVAPLSLMVLLLMWLGMFLFGFGLILWQASDIPFDQGMRAAGSALFTLGFVEAATAGSAFIHFAASFTGLLVLALQIAYLPVLYSAFNRRETLVSKLDTRAGVPAWGPELLARHSLVNITDNLPRFYDEWETWTADVAESHTNYPVLLSFRSPQPDRNWVVALLAVLDSAALYLAAAPSRAPSEARLCLRMGFTGLRDIARAAGIPFNPDPLPTDPITLTREEFDRGLARMREARFPVEAPDDEIWRHFRGWRVNYEQIAYALADRIDAVRAPWSGPRSFISGGEIPPFRPADRRPDDPHASRPLARPSDPGPS